MSYDAIVALSNETRDEFPVSLYVVIGLCALIMLTCAFFLGRYIIEQKEKAKVAPNAARNVETEEVNLGTERTTATDDVNT